MTITVGGTSITFNDATTQTTAPVNTNANVNSITAGTGISVSASTGAVTISATGGGTVTSVATGNGLSGGTITTTGTLTVACPTFNTVGSYVDGNWRTTNTTIVPASGSNYSAGTSNGQVQSGVAYTNQCTGTAVFNASNNLSGTWKWMAAPIPYAQGSSNNTGLMCRVS